MNFSTWLMGDCTQAFQWWIFRHKAHKTAVAAAAASTIDRSISRTASFCDVLRFVVVAVLVVVAVKYFCIQCKQTNGELVARTSKAVRKKKIETKLYGPENVFDRLMILLSDKNRNRMCLCVRGKVWVARESSCAAPFVNIRWANVRLFRCFWNVNRHRSCAQCEWRSAYFLYAIANWLQHLPIVLLLNCYHMAGRLLCMHHFWLANKCFYFWERKKNPIFFLC